MSTLFSWSHFVWQTTSLPSLEQKTFLVRRAQLKEKEKVVQVALLSLKMNTEWHDASEMVAVLIEEAAHRAFVESQEPSSIVVTHGGRIIGVSILDSNAEATFHLASGPWVLTEYRNRGVGSLLLQASLQELSERGLVEVRGQTRGKSIAARFVYPKFGGTLLNSSTILSRK